jgi:integrase
MGLMPKPFTVHGMRSAFAMFCAEQTEYPFEICEQALAHSVGTAVSKAYRRTDLLEKRRELMKVWADFLTGGSTSQHEQPSLSA